MGVIARQSFKASIVGFLGVGVGAINVLFILPKFLTPEEIGVVSTIQRASILLYSLMILGVVFSIRKFNKETIRGKSYGHSQFLGANVIFLLGSITLYSLAYILNHDLFVDFFIQNSAGLVEFVYLPLVLAIVIVFFHYFFAISGSFYRITLPNFFNGFVNRVMVIFAIVAYGYGLLQFESFVYAYQFLFYGVPLVLTMLYVLKVLKVRIVIPSIQQLKDVLQDTFRYNVFLYLTITSSIIIISIDTLMISSMKGTYETGVYTIAFFIATIIEIPQRMLVQVASPMLSNKIKDNKLDDLKDIYQKSSMVQLFIGYSIFILIWFNLDALYAIMPNGNLYQTGATVVLLISAAKIIDIGFGLNKQIIEMSDYFSYNLYINILLSILVIVLNLILIPTYGINGAALASLLAVSTTNLISFLLVWFKSKIIPFSKKTLIILGYSLLSGFALHYFLPAIENPWLSIALNSLIMGAFILVLAYLIDMMRMVNELKIFRS